MAKPCLYFRETGGVIHQYDSFIFYFEGKRYKLTLDFNRRLKYLYKSKPYRIQYRQHYKDNLYKELVSKNEHFETYEKAALEFYHLKERLQCQ
ncbi:MAG: hypothetical protein RSF67_02725 [Clostridia bacterium]